jgi:hypothetical protein
MQNSAARWHHSWYAAPAAAVPAAATSLCMPRSLQRCIWPSQLDLHTHRYASQGLGSTKPTRKPVLCCNIRSCRPSQHASTMLHLSRQTASLPSSTLLLPYSLQSAPFPLLLLRQDTRGEAGATPQLAQCISSNSASCSASSSCLQSDFLGSLSDCSSTSSKHAVSCFKVQCQRAVVRRV